MNWRIIVGLLLIILGLSAFYLSYSEQVTFAAKSKLASVIWVAAGLFLLIRGTRKLN